MPHTVPSRWPLPPREAIRSDPDHHLANPFSKKLDNHVAAVALHDMHYNSARIPKTLRLTPAMQAGPADHVWSVAEIVGLLNDEPVRSAA